MSNETSKRLIVKRDLKEFFPKEFTSRSLIGKFFDYVMNNFFEKSYERYVNGYIGKKTQTLEEGNFYLKEPTAERQLYQLTPMLITKDSENNINNIIDYISFINTLKLQGALTNNHNRLLNNEHWSFCPPIDVDMFLNYNFYYWIEDPKPTYVGKILVKNDYGQQVESDTNVVADIIGKTDYEYTYYNNKGNEDTKILYNGMRIIFTSDVNEEYNNKVFIVEGVGKSIYLLDNKEGLKPIYLTNTTNAVIDIIGQSNYTYEYDDNNGEHIRIPFYNGMRIIFKSDNNFEYNNKPFIVEGVGKNIQLINDSEIYNPLNTDEPEYFVMDRGCKDENPWSLRNKWFHINDIKNANLYNQIDSDTTKYVQANKPILCFNKDIELYNFGTHSRGWVDIITTTTKGEIQGKLLDKNVNGGKLLIDGVYLDSKAKILFTNESNNDSNNMIYELFLIENEDNKNLVTLYPVINGLDPDGKPLKGDCIKVKNKLEHCYHYNGEKWVLSQQKTESNQSPLFNLYDKNKTLLNDKETYPNSNFRGCTLFNYKSTENKSVKLDEDIKRRLIISNYGNYVFDNTIISKKYSYKKVTLLGTEIKNIEGYNYYKIIDKDDYKNCWHLSKDNLTQYVITEITVEGNRTFYTAYDDKDLPIEYEVFDIAYKPLENNVKENIFVYLNGELLEKGEKLGLGTFTVIDKKLYISLKTGLKEYDTIYIKILIDDNDEELVDGYVYDLPQMLTSNGLNEDITEIKYNEMFKQFESILKNQIGFEGLINGANNYKDTLKDVSLGTELLQHSTPILKTMLLNSKEYTNVRNVLSNVCHDYTKFKNKFSNTIESMSKNNEYNEYIKSEYDSQTNYYMKTNTLNIVLKALNKINIGKEGLQPYFNNGVAEQLINLDDESDEYLKEPYIPSTPAYLGLDNCYEPAFIYPKNDLKKSVLLCHDGSYEFLFGDYKNDDETTDYRDNAKMELEKQIFNSINQRFKDGLPIIIKQKYIPGKFRKTNYTYDEYIKLYTPLFEKWVINYNVDYSENNTFDEYNPFTWNWSSCFDKDGMQLPGSYRAIYLYYYDTDKPDICPWEMLGFGVKPSWWEEHYGKAPYTSINIPMWKDIEEGHIIDGPSEGIYEEFKRPGLVDNYLPVDENGNLLNPYEIGITKSKPILKYASDPWKIGDMGYIENIWRYSSEYRYAIQEILYLMKPLEWLETSWDSLNTDTLFRGTSDEQIININSGIRDVQNDIIMHNEYIDGNYVRKLGSQQWFSDFLTSETINITNYIANDLRNMNIQLGYRCAGFFDKETIKVMSDNYGIIPSNNYYLKLNSKPTGKVYRYSAVIIKKLPLGWLIDGFDDENPYFYIYEPNKNGRKTPIEINGRNFTYYNTYSNNLTTIKYKTIIGSSQEVYNILCGYEKYLESIGFVFNIMSDSGEQVDFRYDGKKFLLWCDNRSIEYGNMLLLNPCRYGISLQVDNFVDIIGKWFNGHWSVKNQLPTNIYNNDLNVYRHNGYITVNSKTDNPIATIKFTTSEKENILIFDNETIYGDTIYNSLKGTKTERFKLLGTKANAWNGTYYTPGYIINTNETIESDYDKLADDLIYVYDSDNIKSFGKIGDEAKKTIGYHKTRYMENLLIDNRNMFDFYKGMLKEKGTRLAFNKLNRSTHIMSEGSSKLNLNEFWAFKTGQFGYTKNKSTLEFLINAENITHDPQIVTFSSDPNYIPNDSSNIGISWNDNNWLKKHNNQDRSCFEYKNNFEKLPSGGFAQLDDCNYILETPDIMEEAFDNIKIGEKIWIVKDTDYTWNMYKKINNSDDAFKSLRVNNISELLSYNNNFLEKGDLIYVEKDNLSNYIISMSDNISDIDNNLNICINDPNGLLKNQNYIVKDYGWSIFKYIAEPYCNILSMPNKIISLIDNDINYSLRIENDLLLNLPNGISEDGMKFKEYTVKNDIPILLENEDVTNNDRYIIFVTRDDENEENNENHDTYYKCDNFVITNDGNEPDIKRDFWYDYKNNNFSRWNGNFWENSLTPLYAWKNNSTIYYTLNEEPNTTSIVYSYENNTTSVIADSVGYTCKKYAWKKQNTNTIYYTDSITPEAGDKLYNSPTSIINPDIISSYFDGSDYLYCDNTKYIRSVDNDHEAMITFNNLNYIRSVDNDIKGPYFCLLAKIKVDNGNINNGTDLFRLNDISIFNPYILERIEQKPININLLKSIYLVDDKSDKTLSKAYLFDPLHCILPEDITKELDYITSYDPVNYDNSNAWLDNKIGRLWWDTSKVRYIDYYQGSLKYRRDNWGKQLPGSEIDIMEWTKSTILPENTEKYITKKIFNAKNNKYDTYYYYWLQNPSVLPDINFRTNTAYDISRKINSPQDSGLIWFAPINLTNRMYDDSSFIICNFDSVATSQDFVVQINFKNINDVNEHNEWHLITENSDNNIPDNLWDKMKYSLIGEMKITESLSSSNQYIGKIDDDNNVYNEDNKIIGVMDKNNNVYDKNNNLLFHIDELKEIQDDEDNKIIIIVKKTTIISLPDESLTENEKYGISIRPKQTMFKNIINARRNFVDVCNDVFSSRDIETSSTDDLSKILIKDNSYENYIISETFTSHESMLLNNDKSLIGENVLVSNDELYDGIWTLWYVESIDNYTLIDYQKYDVNRYTYFIDAFLDDNYSKDTYHQKIYDINKDKEISFLIQRGIPNGYIIRIDDYNTKDWIELLQYNSESGTFNIVGLRNGYIQLNDKLYSYMETSNDSIFIDDITKYDYDNQESKKVIEILCNYFEEN